VGGVAAESIRFFTQNTAAATVNAVTATAGMAIAKPSFIL
jgi:hypothetical protein